MKFIVLPHRKPLLHGRTEALKEKIDKQNTSIRNFAYGWIIGAGIKVIKLDTLANCLVIDIVSETEADLLEQCPYLTHIFG